MPKIYPISWKNMIKILLSLWFEIYRIAWSHHFMKHSDGRITVILLHKNEDLWIWLLKKILRDINLSDQDFDNLR